MTLPKILLSVDGNFNTKKDLRQGDPLPPFFFIIILEALSYMLDRSGEWGAFPFLP